MKLLIQRVSRASVSSDNVLLGKIKDGLLIFLGVAKGDNTDKADYLADKIVNLRIFSDHQKKMNQSLLDIKGSCLVISQFTLLGDCRKGRRPSFEQAASPEEANFLYEYFIRKLKTYGLIIETGKFAADMQVEILNDGPVTFMLEA